ncbi:hypothetical protein [Microbulbifer sp. MCCC 1A16149]|uniref:hypothetical protein n=1 Tax=Microbulbifer sp. MCCC 1A16149 TaxID=3411322 RepID=UPI003D11F5A5
MQLLKNLAAPIIGAIGSSCYGYLAIFTVVLKGTWLDKLYIGAGVVGAPIGALLLWIAEALGLVVDSGMAGGIIIFALGGFVVWAYIFFVIAHMVINRIRSGRHH